MAVQFVTVIRHSKAVPAVNGDDINRPLSEAGIALAQKRCEQLKDVRFDVGIVSNRLRTAETFAIVSDRRTQLLFKDERFFEQDRLEDDELMNAMYERIGEKSVCDYLTEATSEEFEVLRRFAESRWQLILNFLYESGAQNALVVNHGVYAPAILLEGCGNDMPPTLVDRWWKECEGVRLEVDGGRIVKCEPLPELS